MNEKEFEKMKIKNLDLILQFKDRLRHDIVMLINDYKVDGKMVMGALLFVYFNCMNEGFSKSLKESKEFFEFVSKEIEQYNE
jgi:hypothetical protein